VTRGRLALILLLAGTFGAASGWAQGSPAASPAPASPRLHLVAMVERGQYGIAFDPQRTTAALGDTVRFVQQGALPHNVMFRSFPSGAQLGAALEGPLVTAPGATYDLVLDHRFVPGKYLYVCVPHETLGMAGLLYVGPADPGH
jgi:plastocyanin